MHACERARQLIIRLCFVCRAITTFLLQFPQKAVGSTFGGVLGGAVDRSKNGGRTTAQFDGIDPK